MCPSTLYVGNAARGWGEAYFSLKEEKLIMDIHLPLHFCPFCPDVLLWWLRIRKKKFTTFLISKGLLCLVKKKLQKLPWMLNNEQEADSSVSLGEETSLCADSFTWKRRERKQNQKLPFLEKSGALHHCSEDLSAKGREGLRGSQHPCLEERWFPQIVNVHAGSTPKGLCALEQQVATSS